MTTLSPRSHLRAIAASSLYFTPRYDPPFPRFRLFGNVASLPLSFSLLRFCFLLETANLLGSQN